MERKTSGTSLSVGADLGILLNLIHRSLKEKSKLAIAQKDYKPLSKCLCFVDDVLTFSGSV